MDSTAYFLLRIAVGASMFGHGLVRFPKLQAFSNWMTGLFEKSILPNALVLPFSFILPVAEFVVGLFLLVGLVTRQASIAGAVVMIMLVMGSCLIENWESLPSQLIHIAFFAVLIQFVNANKWAIDSLIKK